jgi:hypothetical protein
MNRTINFTFLFAGFLLLAVSCMTGHKKPDNLAPNAHMVKAEEVIQGSSYTYLRVTDEGNEYWMAINRMEIKEGGIYYWSDGMPMKNFTSKELKRTFPDIFFVNDFTDQPITQSGPMPHQAAAPSGRQQVPEQQGIKVVKAEGGITIAELYAGKADWAGKKVKISGVVVKYSPQIMDRNWVHLQDGTKSGNSYDLTITTTDSVEVGAVLIFEGMIALDKDFGAGYFYDVIMEQGKTVSNTGR